MVSLRSKERSRQCLKIRGLVVGFRDLPTVVLAHSRRQFVRGAAHILAIEINHAWSNLGVG